MNIEIESYLKKLVRTVPDFPRPGILFYDITPILNDKTGFVFLIDELVKNCRKHSPDVVVGVEARGFIFAPTLAYHLGVGFVPLRKPNKLPSKKLSISYDLEYGSETLEIHEDAIKPGERVMIIDDLLATGGTLLAATRLIERLKGQVVGLGFVIELEALKGREKLKSYQPFSLLKY